MASFHDIHVSIDSKNISVDTHRLPVLRKVPGFKVRINIATLLIKFTSTLNYLMCLSFKQNFVARLIIATYKELAKNRDCEFF